MKLFQLPLLTRQIVQQSPSRRLLWGGGLLGAIATVAIPVFAQDANFAPITITAGFPAAAGIVRGNTGGAFSLAAIANRDRAGNLCLGFAESTPDHILTLQSDFARLNLQVDSGGNDTTLVLQGPDRQVLCGDDTGRNKDASLQGTNWQAGTYRVWVGAFNSGARYDYTLRVSE